MSTEDEHTLTDDQKYQKLYNILLNAFDCFKKYANKKDENLQNIKEIHTLLQTPEKNFCNTSQVYKYSFILIEPLENCTSRALEVILTSMEDILKYNLLPPEILMKMIEKLISYIDKNFLSNNVDLDFGVVSKIPKICELIYTNKYLFIHNEKLKKIINLYIRIYLFSQLYDQPSNQNQRPLFSLINKMIEKISVCNITNNNYQVGLITKNASSNKLNTDIKNSENTDELFKLILNEYNFVSKKYLDFLIDLIEIQSKLNSNEENKCDIINKYINIIKSASGHDSNNDLIKKELESLDLSKLDLEYINEENGKSYKIGKYGWCILCRKTANHWNNDLKFPVCSKDNIENNCGLEFGNCLNSIDARSDFLYMLIYLFIKSSTDTKKKGTNQSDNDQLKLLYLQFCLENIKEMIAKSYGLFKNDNDVIFIIKEIFKNSLLKNTLSFKIKIFQISIEIFINIMKAYRSHLKEEIEIFFLKVFIAFLESENIDFVFKDAVLDALLLLVDNAQFLVEIYVNYDCDVNCNAVFSVLINLLTKIMNGLYKKSKYQNTFKPLQENLLVEKTLTFLNKFVYNLNNLVEKNERLSNNKPENLNNVTTTNTNEDNETISSTNETKEESLSSSNLIDVKDKINKNLRIKKLLEKAIEVFNIGKSTSECLKYLQKNNMIFKEPAFLKIKNTYIDDINNNTIKNDYSKLLNPEEHTIISEMTSEDLSVLEINKETNIMETPFISQINPLVYFILNVEKEKLSNLIFDDYIAFEMARFIRTNLKLLIRDRVGDYLCSGKPFNIKVLTYFINSFDFRNNNIFDAMRVLFNELPLSGEAQVIDRVVQTFGEKFHKQNPKQLKNPDWCYYLSFSLLQLNTDLHRDEVEKKMTLKEFIEQLNLSTGNEKIDPSYLEELYNKVLTDPLVIPGQKIKGMSKNKKELLKKEKLMMEMTFGKIQTNTTITITNNYITDIDNDNIRHLLEFSWSNFFSIYSRLLSEYENDKNIQICIEIILIMARMCGILKLNTAEEAYINTIINMTNLNDNREINVKNLYNIRALINFIINSGKYIRTGWLSILQIISKLEYYLMTENETIINNVRKKPKTKLLEKEININLQKKDILCKNIPDFLCEGIFSKTDEFDEETIIKFIVSLCTVSKEELTDYYTPRVFSLHKLVEVADFNIFRIQVQWVKIWKLIADHLVDVISHSMHEGIWKQALDSLRQTICKLLQKKDLSIYNFQMDFFKPFEIIFSQTKKTPERGEMIIKHIHYISGSFGKNIHSGWIVIFRILKEGFQRKIPALNEDIKEILQQIYEDSTIINNDNIEVFRGYIECLCYMYLDNNLKQYGFETILNLLAKIMNDVDNEDGDITQLNDQTPKINKMQLPNINKKFDFLKIFFYGFDDLIQSNVIEHLNLLFEIINHNKNIIFSKDSHSFLYMYYSYFKPHLIILLLSRYINRFELFEKYDDKNLGYYSKFVDNNSLETKTENIRVNLIDSIISLIDDFNSDEGTEYDKMFYSNEKKNEHKRALAGFLKEIKEEYSKDEMTLTIKKKLLELSNLDDKNYEVAVDFFLGKFKDMYTKIKDQEKEISSLKYNYFYEDLFITIHKLLVINSSSDVLLRILNKILSINDNIKKESSISPKCIEKINELNLFVLNLISHAKKETNEEKLHKLISFSSNFSNFLLSFIQHYESDTVSQFKLILKIFIKILEIDLENVFERFKIVTSSSTVDLLIKLQGIESYIIQQTKENEIKNLYTEDLSINIIIYLDKIYDKYKLANEENSLMNGVMQFELENILPKFIKCFNDKELKELFKVLLSFTEAMNNNLRKAAKNILSEFIPLNLVYFKKFEDN